MTVFPIGRLGNAAASNYLNVWQYFDFVCGTNEHAGAAFPVCLSPPSQRDSIYVVL